MKKQEDMTLQIISVKDQYCKTFDFMPYYRILLSLQLEFHADLIEDMKFPLFSVSKKVKRCKHTNFSESA